MALRGEATAERILQLHEVAARARPVALAREHVLPVLEPLRPLLPDGLRRGSTVAVGDSTSLALALLAGPSGEGSWAAAVGVSNLGLAAAAELGVALDRLVVVANPQPKPWASVVAALVDALDVVLLRTRRRVSGNDARRLIARARERGSVLIVLGDSWPEAPDVRLSVVRGGMGRHRRRLRPLAGAAGGDRVEWAPRCVPREAGRVVVAGSRRRHRGRRRAGNGASAANGMTP